MAKVQVVLDDVILAMKNGQRKIADRSSTLNIPAQVSTTGKRRFMKLDISDDGEKMLQDAIDSRDKIMRDAETKYNEGLEKLQADREKAESNAWKALNQIADKVDEMKPRRNRKDDSGSENSTEESQDAPVSDQNDSTGTTSHSDSPDVSQAPVQPQYGQPAPSHNQWN